MKVPLLDLRAEYLALKPVLDAAWFDAMESAAFIGGARVGELESAIGSYCGVQHAIACASGTDALFLVLNALGVGEGDEVVTTPFTFWATIEAIAHVGAVPVFVDIEPGSYNMDVEQLEACITERTAAIMPVHIFGQCVDMDPVLECAKRHGLAVIEDACQAIGATYKGKRAGSMGDAAAFSFFPSKNLGCAGDGGMVTTNRADVAEKVRLAANHGSRERYHHTGFGVNSRLDALQAAILSAKLPHLDEWNRLRREAAARYDAMLGDTSGIVTPLRHSYGDPVYHLYVVKSDRARHIVKALGDAGVETSFYYPVACHQQEAFRTRFAAPVLPVVESCDHATFALPCFPTISPDQQRYVVDVVKRTLANAG